MFISSRAASARRSCVSMVRESLSVSTAAVLPDKSSFIKIPYLRNIPMNKGTELFFHPHSQKIAFLLQPNVQNKAAPTLRQALANHGLHHAFRPWSSFRSGHRTTKISECPQSQRRWYGRNLEHRQVDNFKSANWAVWTIVIINGAVFAAWQYADTYRDTNLKQKLRDHTVVSQANIDAGRWYTVVTAAFSHRNLTHFIFNMFSLHAFYSIMTCVPGITGSQIWMLCLGGAAASSLCWLTYDQRNPPSVQDRTFWPLVQHGRTSNFALGASGIVMTVGAVATCLMPRASMYLFLIPIPIPLWLTTVGYALADIYYLDSSDNIGHSAHLGGAIFGTLIYAMYFRRFGGILASRRR